MMNNRMNNRRDNGTAMITLRNNAMGAELAPAAIAIRNEESGTNRIIKGGILTAGTVAAVGLAIGLSPVTVSAAEVDADVTADNNMVSEQMTQDSTSAEKPVTVAEAQTAADTAQAKVDSAEADVAAAEAEKTAADNTVQEASEAADQAEADLNAAESVRDGEMNAEDTPQYQDTQEKKAAMDQAANDASQAKDARDQAEEALADADAGAEAAQQEKDAADDTLEEKDAALSEAAQAKTDADRAKDDAQKAYDAREAEAVQAAADVIGAEAGLKDANDAVLAAEANRNQANEAAGKARAEVQAAERQLTDADAERAEAEAAVAEGKTAVKEAQDALEEVSKQYAQGTLGMIDWMLERDGLTEDQKMDLESARTVLEDASEEDFSKWPGGTNTGLPESRNGKVVVIGDEKDATNLENLLKSIEIMKKINTLRASDDNFTGDLQRNDSYTNFYFVATAETGAMRGAGLLRHSLLTTSCEDLSYSATDPTIRWYNREKAIFDRIKGELGISKITSMDDVSRIEAEADRQDAVVGHYTNLFWAVDQVMGVGFTEYRNTSCYNASKASNYTDNRYGRAMRLYTIDEFEQLVKEYYQTVDVESYQTAVIQAEAKLAAAETALQSFTGGNESRLQTAKEELTAKEAEAEQAQQALTEAQQACAEAEMTLEQARSLALTANQALDEVSQALADAAETSKTADVTAAYAEKEYTEAKDAADSADAALSAALQAKAEAQAVLEEKESALTDANGALTAATAVYETAAQNLEMLTSDEYINALRERKTLADAALEEALAAQETAAQNLLEKTKAYEMAQRAYAAAIADLTIQKNQEAVSGNGNGTTAAAGGCFVYTTNVIGADRNTAKSDAAETAESKQSVSTAADAGDADLTLFQTEDTGHVYSLEPVQTGDAADIMPLLAELLAGAGLAAVVFRKRKEEREWMAR